MEEDFRVKTIFWLDPVDVDVEPETLELAFFLSVVKLDESREESKRRLDGAVATITRLLPDSVGGLVATAPTTDETTDPPEPPETFGSEATAAMAPTAFDLEMFLMIFMPFHEARCSPSSPNTESSSEDWADILADALVDFGEDNDEGIDGLVMLADRVCTIVLPANFPESAGKAAKYFNA